jgi:hypothetical protein
MNSPRDEEIAASVGAHRDLGPQYDDAIAAGLIERIGAEVDRRVDERVAQHQDAARSAAMASTSALTGGQGQHPPATNAARQISWQQVSLVLGSMMVGVITSVSVNNDHGNGTWPIIVTWLAITLINMAVFRAGRPFRRDRHYPD